MCCFSGTVEHVAGTRIFARRTERSTQFLVYQMTYRAPEPVAMILPLPVRLPATEASLRFLDLKRWYPDFFEDLAKGFPAPEPWWGAHMLREPVAASAALPVHEVGDYVASFVPTRKDFARLDPRFALPADTWARIPAYRDYGFAVFQLRASRDADAVPHPMAFEFETRMPAATFFPTVHIHDGKVHSAETFDHVLYAQDAGAKRGDVSAAPARDFVRIARTRGIVRGDAPVQRLKLAGTLPNVDTILETPGDAMMPHGDANSPAGH